MGLGQLGARAAPRQRTPWRPCWSARQLPVLDTKTHAPARMGSARTPLGVKKASKKRSARKLTGPGARDVGRVRGRSASGAARTAELHKRCSMRRDAAHLSTTAPERPQAHRCGALPVGHTPFGPQSCGDERRRVRTQFLLLSQRCSCCRYRSNHSKSAADICGIEIAPTRKSNLRLLCDFTTSAAKS